MSVPLRLQIFSVMSFQDAKDFAGIYSLRNFHQEALMLIIHLRFFIKKPIFFLPELQFS